jgi:tetratricopeptide (TPR) repeat protein
LGTAVAVVLIYLARQRLGRGAIVAALFFVATLSPVLGFLTLYTFRYSFVADHYQYLACIGPLALAAAGITRAVNFFGPWKRFLQGTLCAALLISLGGLSWAQCTMYSDLDTLWWTTLARNPDSWMAHNNIGISLARQGRTQEAIDHFNRALALNPHHDEADYNLANALLRLNREDEAIPHYEASLKINPRNTKAHFNLAAVLARKGQSEEAMVHYNKVLEVYPNDPVVHKNLEKILRQLGRTDEADAHLRKAEAAQRRPH